MIRTQEDEESDEEYETGDDSGVPEENQKASVNTAHLSPGEDSSGGEDLKKSAKVIGNFNFLRTRADRAAQVIG